MAEPVDRGKGKAGGLDAWLRPVQKLFKPLLTKQDKSRIAMVIEEMESQTTGEIRVHLILRAGRQDVLELAKRKFYELGLQKTAGRNGVIILVSNLDQKFAIWGDEGIHVKAGQILWDRAKKALLDHFVEGRYGDGIEACVREVGKELAVYFPKEKLTLDPNELSNEVTED